MKRGRFFESLSASAAATALIGAAPPGKLERTDLAVGTPDSGPSQLPLYVALAKTFAAEGLNIKFTSFLGDGQAAQALAGGSVDISLASLTGLINLINADQGVLGFYAGFDSADFTWMGQKSIASFADLRGKSIGISTYGALSDGLTRYMLRKNKIDPADVKIIQQGNSATGIASLRAGTLDCSILGTPWCYVAQDEGFRVLAQEAKDVAPRWPKHLYQAKATFIRDNPNTLRAFLRAHVAAIRLLKRDPSVALGILTGQLKYTPAFAQRSYTESLPAFDESGRLPAAAMPLVWQIAIANKDVSAPWPEAKFFDPTFVNTFKEWAPHGG
jgi:NitT/TauT family transport system substrate-binding protein